MIGGVLDKLSSYLGPRVVVGALVPTILFSSALVALVASRLGQDRSLRWWTGLPPEARILLLVSGGAAVVLLALMLAARSGDIMRLYEGYWGRRGLGDALTRLGKALQRARWRGLDITDPGDYETRYRCYPRHPEDLLPTRLGNALRSAELYPSDEGRYGMDAIFFWPRLYAVTPDTTRRGLEDARSSLDLMLLMSALGYVFAIVAAAFLIATRSADPRLWASVLIALLVGLLAYRAAVRTAVEYGELVRSCFDLYRGDLRRQMGFAAPASLDAERGLWKNLSQQLYRRAADDPSALRYPPA